MLAVNKVTWQQVGRVTEPGRYMFKFGWLTITAEDLAVWSNFRVRRLRWSGPRQRKPRTNFIWAHSSCGKSSLDEK